MRRRVHTRYRKSATRERTAQANDRIGLLDFLRELKSGVEAMPRCAAFQVVGLDEALYLAGQEGQEALLLAIRRVLQAAAQKLEQRIIEVQVIFKGKLVKGDSLWLEFRGERFPLDCIFGTLTKKLVRDDIPVYETGFNLSS